jgi:hypothetical protein
MLVDISAYTGHWPFRNLRGNNLAELLQRMNVYGVNKAIVSNLNGLFYVDSQIANEELNKEILSNELFKDRFIPFATINPALPWWKDALKTCHEKFGMKGLRIFPLYHHYKLTDDNCIDMVKAARDLGMPISIPLRMTDLRERSWFDVNEALSYNDVAVLVSKVPDAKYMILDARITDNQPATSNESIDILKSADVLFDTSRGSGVPVKGPNSESLTYLKTNFGAERLAFGTETPFVDYCSPFFRLAAFEELDEKQKAMVWAGNAERMLKI